MKVWYIVGMIVLVLVVGIGGFIGGVAYGQSQSQSAATNFQRLRGTGNPYGQGGPNGQNGQGNAFTQFGRPVARGSIKSVNGNTIQISTAQNVVTVKVGDKTTISKTDAGTLSDLKQGDRVTVFSNETGDSPTASTIQIQNVPGSGQ